MLRSGFHFGISKQLRHLVTHQYQNLTYENLNFIDLTCATTGLWQFSNVQTTGSKWIVELRGNCGENWEQIEERGQIGQRATAVTIFLFLCPVINHDYFTSISEIVFRRGYSLIKLLRPGSINLRPIDLRQQFSGESENSWKLQSGLALTHLKYKVWPLLVVQLESCVVEIIPPCQCKFINPRVDSCGWSH